jgi:hypothetical protein
MRAYLVAVSISVMALSMIACGPGLKAPKMADGSKIGLYVAFDRNISADAEPEKAVQRNQMSDYLELDLPNLLKKYDYDVFPLANVADFVPGPNKYLMTVKVLSYSAGSKGARIAGALMGGWGGAIAGDKGAAFLDLEYKVSGEKGKVVGGDINLRTTDPNWQVVVRMVDSAILKGTSKAMQKLYKK